MTIEGAELARRLRRAREAAGITQEEASAALKLARPAMVQIEKGSRTVSGLELDQLATLYGSDLRSLLGDGGSEGPAFFRKDEFAEFPELLTALQDALRIGRDLAKLEKLTGVDRSASGVIAYDYPRPKSLHQAISQGLQCAEAERRRLGLSDEPIGDIVDILDAAGVRTSIIDMPEGISGVTMNDAEVGTLIAVSRRDHVLRRTFSLAHEYGHSLLDRAGGGSVTRADAREDLREVRANSFASALLMPEAGVRRRLDELGKSAAPTLAADAFDGKRQTARDREAPALRLHDVAVIAHGFGVSRLAMLNRLRSLRLITPKRFEALRQDDAETGAAIARLLALTEPDHVKERQRFDRRYIRLALEAHLAGHIGEEELLRHLVDNAGLNRKDASSVIETVTQGHLKAVPPRRPRTK